MTATADSADHDRSAPGFHGIETMEPDALTSIGDERAATGPSRHVRRVVDDGQPLVVKVATTSGRDDLRREAEVLDALRGPDVVSLVELRDGPDSTELVLRDVGGPSLAAALAAPTTSTTDGARLLAATCRTVSRLHASGWAHGRVSGDHVLMTPRGRLRLCSLATAEPIDVDPSVQRSDRASLLRMVDDWVDDWTGAARPSGLLRVLDRVRITQLARRTARLPDDPDPLVLARILDRSTGRLTSGGRAPRLPSRRTTLRILAVVAFVGAVGAALAGWGAPAADDDSATAPARSSTTTTTSTTTTSTSTSTISSRTDGVVTFEGRRYRVGAPGDVVAVGDWDCDGRPTVALVRAATGEIQVFDGWATGTDEIVARTIGVIDSTPIDRTISIAADPSGCGPPRVTTTDGRSVRMEVRP